MITPTGPKHIVFAQTYQEFYRWTHSTLGELVTNDTTQYQDILFVGDITSLQGLSRPSNTDIHLLDGSRYVFQRIQILDLFRFIQPDKSRWHHYFR